MKKTMQIKYLNFPLDFKIRGKLYMSAVKRVFSSGTYTLSEEVAKFEKEFAKYLGVKYCVGVANGLEAIQIALMSKGITVGDEVITTPISAVASTLAIIAVGAKPVFTDITPMGQIDHSQIEKLINKKTKAILPVDLYGQPSDMAAIKKIADKFNLFVVEDACQAHGSAFRGKKLGTYGDAGAFSFYPTKNIGAVGDGGALVTNNTGLAEAFRQIRDYGQKSKYVHERYGLNSRLDELQAAIVQIKLKFLDEDNNKRLKVAKRYIANLKGTREIEIVLPEKVEDSNFHLFVIKTNKRDGLQKYLKENGIPSLIHFPVTIPDQPMFGGKYKKLNIPVARRFVREILSLPCHPYLDNKEVDYISNKIIAFFKVKEIL
jgi:dTDP-4-amino-4,6-dideoxygalactose transaminase